MTHRVVFSKQAQQDLTAIKAYIRRESSARIANAFADALLDACESLSKFPMRGSVHTEIGPAYRVVGFRHTVGIHFEADDSKVRILMLAYKGLNWPRPLR